jgi:hypothetical protein
MRKIVYFLKNDFGIIWLDVQLLSHCMMVVFSAHAIVMLWRPNKLLNKLVDKRMEADSPPDHQINV